MKRFTAVLLLGAVLFAAITSHAAPAADADEQAALEAATAWLAILDAGNFNAAGAGVAKESLANIHWPTPEENAAAMGNLLALQRTSGGTRKVARQLQPDATKRVTSCNCGIRDGDFYVFTYSVKYSWLDHHVGFVKEGTEVLYMLRESDGSWKPAFITLQVDDQHAFPA
jgi:hypothetical protein